MRHQADDVAGVVAEPAMSLTGRWDWPGTPRRQRQDHRSWGGAIGQMPRATRSSRRPAVESSLTATRPSPCAIDSGSSCRPPHRAGRPTRGFDLQGPATLETTLGVFRERHRAEFAIGPATARPSPGPGSRCRCRASVEMPGRQPPSSSANQVRSSSARRPPAPSASP